MRRAMAVLLAVALLCGCSARETICVNWGIGLPAGGRLVYEADSGPSFHGDGIRYHVFRYEDGARLDDCLTWQKPADAAAEVAHILLDQIGVPEEERIDFAACPFWKETQADRSRIYVFLGGGRLFVVEEFF